LSFESLYVSAETFISCNCLNCSGNFSLSIIAVPLANAVSGCAIFIRIARPGLANIDSISDKSLYGFGIVITTVAEFNKPIA